VAAWRLAADRVRAAWDGRRFHDARKGGQNRTRAAGSAGTGGSAPETFFHETVLERAPKKVGKKRAAISSEKGSEMSVKCPASWLFKPNVFEERSRAAHGRPERARDALGMDR
jgi:hypothetical protein